jgi:hypothetical protein
MNVSHATQGPAISAQLRFPTLIVALAPTNSREDAVGRAQVRPRSCFESDCSPGRAERGRDDLALLTQPVRFRQLNAR